MSNKLCYKIKDNVVVEKHRLIDLFFRDFVDGVCNEQVNFRLEHTSLSETIIVEFDNKEDALVMQLRGVPSGLSMYIEIVN